MDQAQPLVTRKTQPPDDGTQATRDLELARARLQASFSALQARWGALRDWRSWPRRHPLPFVLAAFGLGALLGWRDRR